MDENFQDDLAILVEMDLYERIRAIREGNFSNESQIIKKEIEKFEKNLPDRLKGLNDSHNFIIKIIERIDKETAEKNVSNMGNKKTRNNE